jgi:hypothetical protein
VREEAAKSPGPDQADQAACGNGRLTNCMDNFLELFCVVCLSMSNPPHPQMSKPVGDVRKHPS